MPNYKILTRTHDLSPVSRQLHDEHFGTAVLRLETDLAVYIA